MLSIIFNRGSKDIEDANYVFSPDTYFKNSGYYQNTRQVYNSMHQVYPEAEVFIGGV